LISSIPELLIVTLKTMVWLIPGTSVAGVKVSTTDIGRLMAELAIWYDTTVVLLQPSFVDMDIGRCNATGKINVDICYGIVQGWIRNIE